MDFHSLSRRELQSLCKKNKIPANLTNRAMADSLKSLQFVEGIEEFLNPLESVTDQSTIESPEKSEVTSSACVPRTGGRTTCRRMVKDEDENSQVSNRVRRSTRKFVVGEVGDEKPNKGIETPAATNTRRAQGTSVRRKMDSQLKEVGEDKEIEKEGISETPKVVPGSQRRGPSTVKLAYSTRRSTRLAEKNKDNTNLKKNEKLESFNGELFAEESGENLEISDVKVGECSDDLGEIIESSDIDLKETLDEGLEGNTDKRENSDEKYVCMIEKEIQIESKLDEKSSENFEVVKSEMNIEEDAVEGHECDVEDKSADDSKEEVYGENCEETDPSAGIFNKPLEMVDEIKENSGCAELYLTEKEDVVENVEDKLNANEEEVLEDGNNENDIGFKDGSADDLGEANKYFVDLAAFDKYDEGLENESGKSLAGESLLIHSKDEEERGMDLVSALETMTLEKTYDSLAEESIPDNAKEETAAVELNSSVEFQPKEESANSCDVLDLPLGPSCLTPSKKSASKKTPTTIKKLRHVFDDKENIDNSGTKPILTKEKKKTNDFGQSQFADLSLRQLKKVVKEKTEMSKKKDEQVMSSRPALKAVSENIVAE